MSPSKLDECRRGWPAALCGVASPTGKFYFLPADSCHPGRTIFFLSRALILNKFIGKLDSKACADMQGIAAGTVVGGSLRISFTTVFSPSLASGFTVFQQMPKMSIKRGFATSVQISVSPLHALKSNDGHDEAGSLN